MMMSRNVFFLFAVLLAVAVAQVYDAPEELQQPVEGPVVLLDGEVGAAGPVRDKRQLLGALLHGLSHAYGGGYGHGHGGHHGGYGHHHGGHGGYGHGGYGHGGYGHGGYGHGGYGGYHRG